MAPCGIVDPMAGPALTTLLRVDVLSDGGDLHTRRQIAIDAGFKGIEVALDHQPAISQADVVFASCPMSPPDEAQRNIIALLERSAALGARCLNLTLTPPDAKSGNFDPSMQRDMTSLAYRVLHNIRFEVERCGVLIALEAGAHGHFLSPIELREVIDAVNSWAIGVCVDVNRIAGFSHPSDWVCLLGRRIHSIRFNDFTDRKDAANGGVLDFTTIESALEHIDYGGFVIVGGVGSPKQIRNAIQRPLPLLSNRDNICIAQE
jgi:sugar phosphate isomerase/epimerase